MGLRCSLLGHAFGEPVTERNRERRGAEEAVTVTKLRTCNRCGAETVLSENTEVRHLDSVADQQPPAEPDTQRPEDPTNPEPSPETAEDAGEADVAELIETAEDPEIPASGSQPTDQTQSEQATASDAAAPTDTQTPGTGSTEPAGEPASTAAEGESASTATEGEPDSTAAEGEPASPGAESDDGIIIDDSAEPEGERDAPSSPESATPAADSPAAEEKPLTGRESIDDVEETAAEAATESAGDGPDSGTRQAGDATDETAEPESMFGTATEETTGGEQGSPNSDPAATRDAWKERPPSETSDTEDPRNTTDQPAEGRADPAFQFESPGDADGAQGGSSPAQRGPSGIASEGPLDVDVEAETTFDSLVCPECGFSEAAVSSLRAGDICPECHRGYLAGRR